MPLDLTRTLSDLISIPSVNPMGREVSGPEFFEYRVTEYLEKLFDALGLPWVRQKVASKRENILARLDGATPPEEGGRLVVWEAHQDTVPVDGMTIEPWTPKVEEGRIYGRGSCDIKGGMSAMLAALSRLAEERPPGMPTVVMACTVNEEHGYSGAEALCQTWREPGGFFPRRPDVAVIAEPTELNVVVAHKGALRWRLHTRGRAIHSSRPDSGVNALYKMAPVLQALERYHREALPAVSEHPLCGRATLSVGTIRGGISVNTVPDECFIEIDRRILPGEDSSRVYREIIDYVAASPGVDAGAIDHEAPFIDGRPLADEHNGQLAEELLAVARETVGAGEIVGVPYGTDAAVIASSGVPSVVFGPGCVDQAHTADEWLDLQQLGQASEILYRFAKGSQVG